MSLESLNTAVAFGTFFVIAASAIAALVQLRHLRAGNQLEAVLELEREFRGPELQDALRFVQCHLADSMSDRAFRGELAVIGFIDSRKHPEMDVCNWFNQMGALVKNRLVEEDTFLDLFNRLVVHYWTLLEPAIAVLRRARGDAQYENFEYLAARARAWQARHPTGMYPRNMPRLAVADPWLAADATQGGVGDLRPR